MVLSHSLCIGLVHGRKPLSVQIVLEVGAFHLSADGVLTGSAGKRLIRLAVSCHRLEHLDDLLRVAAFPKGIERVLGVFDQIVSDVPVDRRDRKGL